MLNRLCYIDDIIMIYNDQDTYHLLIWLNHQNQRPQPTPHVYSFHQLHHHNILQPILAHLHPAFFTDAIASPFTLQHSLHQIEQYLLQFQDLLIKKKYRQFLLQNECTSQLIKLVLFVLMKSKVRQQYINRILELQQDTQCYLMNELMKMQKNLEYKTNIKDIIQQVSSLEAENQSLIKQLRDQTQNNSNIHHQIESSIVKNEKMHSKCHSNQHQKIKFMEKLGITSNKDYWQIFLSFQREKQQLGEDYSSLQDWIVKGEEQNKDVSQKMQQDHYIMEHLGQQINKYQQIYHILQCQQQQTCDVVVFDPLQKENANKKQHIKHTTHSQKMIQNSIVYNFSINDESHYSSFFQTDLFEQNAQPIAAEEINRQIEQYKCKIVRLECQIRGLKVMGCKMAKRKADNEGIISSAKSQYLQFHLNYEYCISG